MKQHLESVLRVAKGMTQARAALSDSGSYGDMTRYIAMGQLAYALDSVGDAVHELTASNNEFLNMEWQEPDGLLAAAMIELDTGPRTECNYRKVRGMIAKAHKQFRRFYKRLDYPEITDDDLRDINLGVGGGR